ncbi:MAG: hypothetical protein LBK53_04590 [Heliobacteriaceae bacterium]|jgi:hypothetical protein|nr:hypothetical protein [Heliobacteriaceae bacterium]
MSYSLKVDKKKIEAFMKSIESIRLSPEVKAALEARRIPAGLSTKERMAYIQAHGGPGLRVDPEQMRKIRELRPKEDKIKKTMQQLYLSNPYTNPLGWAQHLFNPNKPVNRFDGLLQYLC